MRWHVLSPRSFVLARTHHRQRKPVRPPDSDQSESNDAASSRSIPAQRTAIEGAGAFVGVVFFLVLSFRSVCVCVWCIAFFNCKVHIIGVINSLELAGISFYGDVRFRISLLEIVQNVIKRWISRTDDRKINRLMCYFQIFTM